MAVECEVLEVQDGTCPAGSEALRRGEAGEQSSALPDVGEVAGVGRRRQEAAVHLSGAEHLSCGRPLRLEGGQEVGPQHADAFEGITEPEQQVVDEQGRRDGDPAEPRQVVPVGDLERGPLEAHGVGSGVEE